MASLDYTCIYFNMDKKDIQIIDCTNVFKSYNIPKYINKLLRILPNEDLSGLGCIILYDDSDNILPDRIPGTIRATYRPSDDEIDKARIFIYLNWSLGFYPFLPNPSRYKVWNYIRNKFFIALFGKAHLAQVLYHEIAHHHFIANRKRQYIENQESEKDAEEYMYNLYNKAFPRVQYLYAFFHYIFFNVLYAKDASNISNLWTQYLKKKEQRNRGTTVNK